MLSLFSKVKKFVTEILERWGDDIATINSMVGRGTLAIIRCIPTVLSLYLLFSLVFYMKNENTIIQKFSEVSIERESDILTTLNDLNAKIEKLSDDPNQILALKTQLNRVEQTMVTEHSLSGLAKSAELKNIAMQLQPLTHPASSLHHRVSFPHLNEQPAQPVRLPFQVLSVDSMAGQTYASVQYHHDTLPLRLNDQLAGWKAVRLDSLNGIVVWENPQRRRITTLMTERDHA